MADPVLLGAKPTWSRGDRARLPASPDDDDSPNAACADPPPNDDDDDSPPAAMETDHRSCHSESDDGDDLDESPAGQSSRPTTADEGAAGSGRRKRKRRERACDYCRQRKIKCNGPQAEDSVCSLCRKQQIPCTYVTKSSRRKVPERAASPIKLKLVASAEAGPSTRKTSTDGAAVDGHLPRIAVNHHRAESSTPASLFSPAEQPPVGRQAFAFMGKSSTFALVMETHALVTQHKTARPAPLPDTASAPGSGQGNPPKRPLGERPPWEVEDYADALRLVDCWPVPDLAHDLLGAFFTFVNSVLPLLHEARFKSRYLAGDFLTDRAFASLCLLVFAVAARERKDDVRVWAPSLSLDFASATTFGRASAGWQFFLQATRSPRHRTKPADLGDMQQSALAAMFLGGASANPFVSWTLVGEGLIFAQEVGAHRGGRSLSDDAAEEDAFRRAFWVLFCLDATLTSQMGRTFHVKAGSFDAPVPGADEPAEATDPTLETFRLLVDLAKLLRSAVDILYSLESAARSRSWFVLQLKALHAEADALRQKIPDELRWDPATTDDRLFHQTTAIQLQLQHTLLVIHRPSLPTRTQTAQPPLSPSSFDSAVSAALRTAYVSQAVAKRRIPAVPLAGAAVTEAAGTLGIALLGSKAAGLLVDEEALIQGLQRCCLAIVGNSAWDPLTVGWIDDVLQIKGASVRPPSTPEPASTAVPSFAAPVDPASTLGADWAAAASVAGGAFSLEGLGFGLGWDALADRDGQWVAGGQEQGALL